MRALAAVPLPDDRLRRQVLASLCVGDILHESHFMGSLMTDAAGAGKTVLVVDDHEPTRMTIARLLEAGGFMVRTAENAADALERLERESSEIDMVLSDVTMPGMSGIDLSYKIRETYPRLPVAIVS